MSTSTSSLSMRTTLPGDDLALLDRRGRSRRSWGRSGRRSRAAVRWTRRPRGPAGLSITVCTGRSVAQPYHCRGLCLSRATKRGADRTPLQRDCDVLVCGASFAGLAVARELAGAGARVLVARPLRDRRAPDLGVRRSRRAGCTRWICGASRAPELRRARRPHALAHRPLAAALDVLDVRLPRAVRAALGRPRRRRRVRDRHGHRPHAATPSSHRPRRAARAADRRRARLAARALQRDRRSSRPTRGSRAAWRSTRRAPGEDMELWIDTQLRPRRATPGASPPRDELRVGVGSFWPSHHVKEPTVRLAGDLGLPPRSATRATGSPTSCAARSRTASSSSATPPATACR